MECQAWCNMATLASVHLFIQPGPQSPDVRLIPADIFLHVVQSYLSGSQLKSLFFNGLKEHLHLRVNEIYAYKKKGD